MSFGYQGYANAIAGHRTVKQTKLYLSSESVCTTIDHVLTLTFGGYLWSMESMINAWHGYLGNGCS